MSETKAEAVARRAMQAEKRREAARRCAKSKQTDALLINKDENVSEAAAFLAALEAATNRRELYEAKRRYAEFLEGAKKPKGIVPASSQDEEVVNEFSPSTTKGNFEHSSGFLMTLAFIVVGVAFFTALLNKYI